jgi:hypothetical protein
LDEVFWTQTSDECAAAQQSGTNGSSNSWKRSVLEHNC